MNKKFSHLIPAAGEHSPFYQPYIDALAGENPLESLKTDLDYQIDLLDNSPGLKLDYKYEFNKWTLRQLIIHLIDTERIMSWRILAATRGDQNNYSGYDQDLYARATANDQRKWVELRKEWKVVRKSTRLLISSLQEGDWQKSICIDENEISVRSLLHIICGHARVHFKIVQNKYLP
nr:DinB family protein [Saprospiraceae bacterium]